VIVPIKKEKAYGQLLAKLKEVEGNSTTESANTTLTILSYTGLN
jgi:hypothetical protein